MADATDKASDRAAGERVVIKKYANRRLYNTASSSYVTLDHLADMVREGVDFIVYDAKSNEDITRSVLTQIIFEEESRGENLLPIQFLRQLIRFYGDSMQAVLPSYLEMSLDAFTRQQEQFREKVTGALGVAPGMGMFEEQVRQNMAMFDRAMQMFTPFAFGKADNGATDASQPTPNPPKPRPAQPASAAKPAAGDDTLDQLRRQMAEMQAQIEKLATRK